MSTQLPERVEQAISDALRRVGYNQSLIGRDVEFNLTGITSVYLEPAPLTAFWDQPFDQLTSAIGVRWVAPQEPARQHVDALGKYLWVPFILIARPDRCELWEALPTNGLKEPALLATTSYDALSSTLEARKDELGPLPVRKRKVRYRQMALYEISESPDAFFEWAFRPTWVQLRRLLKSVMEEAVPDQLATTEKVRQLRWLLRFIGVRIAWDKGLLQTASRTSVEELVSAAAQYPVPLVPTPETSGIAEKFIDAVASINLGIADGGLLSHILQIHGLLEDLRSEWKLYPTPPDLAWRMVETIPIEAVPEGNRLIWDGTCGTGTLLVVSMERLRQLSDEASKEPELLRASLLGNDREPLLADLTRIALDTALGKLQGPGWAIKTSNVLDFTATSFPQRPNIIVGNPPFEARGPRADFAIHVLNKYIDILEPGGLLAIVLPRSILGAVGRPAIHVRERLLREFEIYELWELPQGFAPNVSSEAAIICGRKRYLYEAQRSAVAWRSFGPSRRVPPFTDVVPSPDVWLESSSKALEPPLMLRLRAQLSGCRQLSDFVSSDRIAQGITPGEAGKDDVLLEERAECRPYMTGRTGMAPFYIPWHENPRWIRYDSSRLHRARREHQPLFQERKVLIARRSTGGSPWAVQAAVDENALYPSDDFIAAAPEPSLSCEVVAGVFNSALVNCWLRLANPARSILVGKVSAIPIPTKWPEQAQRKIEAIAKELTALRREIATGRGDAEAISQRLEAKTLELDEAVYDAYQVPERLRAEISAYFKWRNKPRPGFDSPLVAEREIKLPSAAEVFTADQEQELRGLLQTSKRRKLAEQEALELDRLIAQWEQAQIVSSEAALKKERATRGSSSRAPNEDEVL